MTNPPKYATRRDASESGIVEALRKAGCTVEIIGHPVDLAVRHPSFPPGMFLLMECKSPLTKAGKRRTRRDQEAQEAFCRDNRVPYALTPEAALQALGLA